jgi:twitching motility protein PilU
MMEKRGLILVVGSTGSGKSTSLAAMIDHRNENSAGHIITVEDPVEYVHKHKKSMITHRSRCRLPYLAPCLKKYIASGT